MSTVRIAQLVKEISNTTSLHEVSELYEELYNYIDPLVRKGYKVSEIIKISVKDYNSVICVPSILSDCD